MVLAAGLGTRMRPITHHTPKPLVPVAGCALIDHALDALHGFGIDRVVVNVHHMADRMTDHLAKRPGPAVAISDETEMLLDSGGGIVKALPLLGDGPFLILNADTFWLEAPGGGLGNLERLSAAWDRKPSDIAVMTTRPDQIVGYDGRGDFLFGDDGRLRRFDGVSPDPVIYPGVAIIDPAIFEAAPPGAFSLNLCFDRAIARGRFHGVAAGGLWLTVGTPEAIGAAEAAIESFRHAAPSPDRA